MGQSVIWFHLAVFVLHLCRGQPPSASVTPSRELWPEEKLVTHLLTNYVKESRPVLRHDEAVDVAVKFSFVRIEDLDEAKDTFSSSVFIVQMWKDPRLKWNISAFGGVRTVRLPAQKIWIPDLVLYNVAHKDPPESLYEETVTVTSDGSVVWVPMLTLYSTCPMDLRNFPYDTQSCQMIFGSWMHTSWEMNVTFISKEKTEMDVVLNEEDSSYHVHQHPQWELVNNQAKAKLSLKTYECCPQPFTLITISVQLRRKPQFYSYLTVGPAAILGLLVPVIYLVPSRGQDKTLFGLLLLLCLITLMAILQQAIPFNHGSLPRICSFYLGTMILTCLSVVTSVIVANITVRGQRRKPLPAWIHSLFIGRNGLRRFLCIGDYGPMRNLYASDLPTPTGSNDLDTVSSNPHSAEAAAMQEIEGSGGDTYQYLLNTADQSGMTSEGRNGQISRYLKFMVGKMAADTSYENIRQEWEELGSVVDRLLFIAFFVLYVFTASSLL